MRSVRDGQPHGRSVHRAGGALDDGVRRLGGPRRPGTTRGLAIDLGSSGARVWIPGHGLVARSAWEDGPGRPVRRGRIVDAESCGRLLARLADTALGADRYGSVIVLSHPVLAGAEHRGRAKELLTALGPSEVVVLSSAKAVAACVGTPDSGPLLVVDMGAELTEVTLLVDGRVADARQAETGLSDLEGAEAGTLPGHLTGNVLDMIQSMWRQDRHGAVRGALRRGPVLTGGGALRPDVTHRIAVRLGAPVRLAGDPSTAVVRGAGLVLDSVLRHHTGTGAVAVLPGRQR
ncbi:MULTISPECIES: rod shape-determining protein [Streptomyces]|uniref:rod shape-determining protein n=1 Tax=Streptomyces TaxID=1883 RepID=UPI00081B5941|nr:MULTISPECIES: rod shape-determining protein [unclassified Streptomyces]MYQ53530.1 rod shape-determining protein MreC [Streptomyces sp. SID4941]SCE07083.1 rod shape-determining protein MreB [Streptomyces sp. PalvLS-984]SDB97694.1 rod shape-determining protein MreB [Streptomyces sp. AmelKG-A3]